MNDDDVICYRCFEDLETGTYFVQSKDFFNRSGNRVSQVQRAEARLVDLIGREVDSRATFATLLEAIEAYESQAGTLN